MLRKINQINLQNRPKWSSRCSSSIRKPSESEDERGLLASPVRWSSTRFSRRYPCQKGYIQYGTLGSRIRSRGLLPAAANRSTSRITTSTRRCALARRTIALRTTLWMVAIINKGNEARGCLQLGGHVIKGRTATLALRRIIFRDGRDQERQDSFCVITVSNAIFGSRDRTLDGYFGSSGCRGSRCGTTLRVLLSWESCGSWVA